MNPLRRVFALCLALLTALAGQPLALAMDLVDSLNPTGYAQVLEELEGPANLSELGAVPLTLRASYSYGHDLISVDQFIGDPVTGSWQTHYYLYDGLGTVTGLAWSTTIIPHHLATIKIPTG